MRNTKILLILLITLTVISCKKDPVDPIPSDIPVGISYSPEAPDADKELTITFKADNSSQLYGYSGDVYVHVGVVVEGVWRYVPADWNQNLAKCKMTYVEDNVWKITLSPSVRAWFNSQETAVNSVGVVIRSSDGSKKGLVNDYFITVTDKKYKGFEPAEIKLAPMPAGVKHGINVVDNSTVTLVLYDKDQNGNHKDFAHVVGDFNDWKLTNDEKSQMYRDNAAGTWWITLTGLDAAKEYAFQYYVGTKAGETIRLGDPYAEKILDPHNDGYINAATYPENKTSNPAAIGISSVFKIKRDDYTWKVPDFTMPNPNKLVIYEMLLRDFTPAGNLTGAMRKLDYLKTLGVNAIELMPVQEFDGNDSWGYNPAYFFAMDKAYGTRTMYKEFIDACHERGMAVILDVVYNHATGAHPFAKLYWDPGKNKTSPNNPWFNVDAPHPYSVFHDFNHESPLVRDYVKRNIDFLLKEYKFDGFRFDLTKGFTQKSSNESTASNYDASRIAILKDYYAQVKASNPNAMMILEHFCADQEERELAEAGMYLWGNKNEAYSETAMGWNTPSKTSFMGINGWTRNWTYNNVVGYMESHDEERNMFAAKTWGADIVKNSNLNQMKRAALNAAFFLTIPGPKMIWQFGELGYDISIDHNGRTGKKPILWNYFEIPERKKLYDTYSKLNVVRENMSTTFDDRDSWSNQFAGGDWANGRRITLDSPTKKMVVLGNFEIDKTINMNANFPTPGVWKDEMENTTITVTDVNMTISIPAHEFKVYTFSH
ncbi:MAG: alpha-amylase [Porphyromonadaceae bacterium]|jgi:1,4-alpha-glucan branching enzyme|nr:alpha-amylase [Porphyromonadaceae bacterium]